MVRPAYIADLEILSALGVLLWEHPTREALAEEFAGILSDPNAQFFLYYADGVPVGFAQCQLRHDYVEGTDSSPVGYLEGIFVREEFRRRGFARELLKACETWSASHGCSEFASDCELGNLESFQFHLSVGFLEANRIICFTKNIGGTAK